MIASGFPIQEAFEVFAPVESVDGKRSQFRDVRTVLTEPDGKFHKARFPKHENLPSQPWFSDPRFNQVTLGFTDAFNNYTINEVTAPRIQILPAGGAVADALSAALMGQNPDLCATVVLPPQIARQRLIEDTNGNLVHLSQTDIDAKPLAEVVARGQALFERDFSPSDGLGPAFNTTSCAACHGLPFNVGVEPLAGGPGVRFRNALQPTESGKKTSRNTPHVFGSGILTELGIEKHGDGAPVADDNANPHNWKGTVPTVRAFTAGALKGELGLESVEKVAELAGAPISTAATLDLDKDGHTAEMTVGDVTAMTAFQASLPRPFQINMSDPQVIHGRQVFENTGCIMCHQPVQTLKSTVLNLTNPETSGVVQVPLGSSTVELFSDLKRHKMGSLLAEPGAQGGIPADVFKTKELWGVGDSAPYLHDGSADTLGQAIDKHRGQPMDSITYTATSEQLGSNLFAMHLTLRNGLNTPIPTDNILLVLTSAPAGVTADDRDGGPAGVGATWNLGTHLDSGSKTETAQLGVAVRYRTASSQSVPAGSLRFKLVSQADYSQALPVIESYNFLSDSDKADLIRFLRSLVLPRRADLEAAALNSLTANDRAILGSSLRSLIRLLQPGRLLFGWFVNPSPDGTGKVSDLLTVQASITAEAGLDRASVVIDGKTVLPLVYRFSSGFHEALLDTRSLAEGEHVLTLDIRGQGNPDDRLVGAVTAVITVDNIPDTSPSNFLVNWSRQCLIE